MTLGVRLTVVASQGEADVICSLLRAEGIKCAERMADSIESSGGWREILVPNLISFLLASFSRARKPKTEAERPVPWRTDVVMAMPPEPMWLEGAAAVGEFFATGSGDGDLTRVKLVPRRANLRPALAAYFDGAAFGIMVFEIRDGPIAEIVGFADAAKIFDRFDLAVMN